MNYLTKNYDKLMHTLILTNYSRGEVYHVSCITYDVYNNNMLESRKFQLWAVIFSQINTGVLQQSLLGTKCLNIRWQGTNVFVLQCAVFSLLLVLCQLSWLVNILPTNCQTASLMHVSNATVGGTWSHGPQRVLCLNKLKVLLCQSQ